ncbi:MAG: YceI family protein [Burkholderiales bacterium]|nr:YceI family protein [Burkholderiales bacterium]
MSLFIRKNLVAAIALAASGLALAAALKVDPAKSNVSAVFKQMNVPIEGKFKKFHAQIDYDSAKPEASKANVDIDIASFDLGSAEFNSEVTKKEWFNAPQFPKASFASTGIKPAVGGKLDVTGKLSIKGKTADVTFPMIVKKEGNAQVFEGSLPIKRLAFNIGEGEWKDTSMVADEVLIKFRVVTTQ